VKWKTERVFESCASFPISSCFQLLTDSFRSAKRRRAKRAIAPAPKSRTIGGAGTSVPPVLVDVPPELDDELLVEEEVEEDVEEDVDVDEEVEELVLDEVDELLVTLPLDVETLPLEVDTLPLDVETLPDEVETPPVEVDTPPVEVETPPVVELVELLMPPVELLVEEITTDPPLLPPPLPPKNPPTKPPPKPPLPPATTTGAPPPPDMTGISAAGRGRGMGGDWVVTVTVCGAQETVFTTLRFTGRTAA
jgi:hypothetical protein